MGGAEGLGSSASGARDAAVAGGQLYDLEVDRGLAQDAVGIVVHERRDVLRVVHEPLALRRGEAAHALAALDRAREALGEGVVGLAGLADDRRARLEAEHRLEDQSGLRAGVADVEEGDALLADGEALGVVHLGPQSGGGGEVGPGKEPHDDHSDVSRGRATSDDARRAWGSWVPRLATNTSNESEKTQTKKND